MHERRAYIRVPVGVEATYQNEKDLASPRLGMSQDVSLGGMRFAPTERLEPGERVDVTLDLPKEGEVDLHGVVVWSRDAHDGKQEHEAGIRWTDVNPTAQARLNSFLSDHTRSYELLSSAPIAVDKPISWVKAVAAGIAIFAVFALLGRLWFERFQLSTEVGSLRSAVTSYQSQINHILHD